MKIVTYNVRVDAPEDGAWNWAARAPHVLQKLAHLAPAAFIVNEATPETIRDLSRLPGYDHIAVPREDGVAVGEAVGIFWATAELTKVAAHTEWLSLAPSLPSYYPGAAYRRTLQTVTLKTVSGTEFCFIGAHLDNSSAPARRFGVTRIAEIAEAYSGPVIAGGDFNMQPQDQAYADLVARLTDAQTIAQATDLPVPGTFQRDQPFVPHTNPITERIDYFFVNDHVKVNHYGIDMTTATNGRYPSDHFPVVMDVDLI